ncbi:MAG: heme exporter protein CcmD [Pseudomonadota bacterium]
MAEYMAMDGYAAYIWSAWTIAGLLLLAIWAASARELRHQASLLARQEAAPPDDAQVTHKL